MALLTIAIIWLGIEIFCIALDSLRRRNLLDSAIDRMIAKAEANVDQFEIF